jgi:selenide,water dikinase
VVDSRYGIEIWAKKIPVIPEALEYAGLGLVPAGAYKNREFREPMIDFAASVDRLIQDIFFDPQTSGGLLICVEKERADDLVKSLKKNGINDAAVIGEVLPSPEGRIVVS